MQPNAPMVRQRNYALDLYKLIAACFVIFIHIPFPGTFGSFVTCLARFAVPLFFAVSGWFSFRIPAASIGKRFFAIVRLEIIATVLHILCSIFWNTYYGGTLRDGILSLAITSVEVKNWVLFNANPFNDTLWYLSASAMCYCFLWIYTKFTQKSAVGYRLLYILSGILLIMFFCMEEFSSLLGMPTPEQIYYRNGFLMGLPFFSMGLCLRQYEAKLLPVLTVPRLLTLLLLGIAIACAEWAWIGYIELYVGTVAWVAALLLLSAVHPNVPTRMEKYACRFGTMSTLVYILHPEIIDFYARLVQHRLEGTLAGINDWIMPIMILLISLAVSAALERLGSCLRKARTFFARNR